MVLATAHDAALAVEAQVTRVLSIVEQKLTLASRLIERLPEPERFRQRERLEELQARFLSDEQAGLREDADRFLREISVVYRSFERSGSEAQEAHRRRYERRTGELASVRDAYGQVAIERPDLAATALDQQGFEATLKAATELAGQRRYEEAYSVLDGAYHQLILAFKTLRDRQTIEYRLEFQSAEEEYAYELSRYESQRTLLQILLAQSPPTASQAAQIEAVTAQAEARHAAAAAMAENRDFSAAVLREEAAVEELLKALRIAGYYF